MGVAGDVTTNSLKPKNLILFWSHLQNILIHFGQVVGIQ